MAIIDRVRAYLGSQEFRDRVNKLKGDAVNGHGGNIPHGSGLSRIPNSNDINHIVETTKGYVVAAMNATTYHNLAGDREGNHIKDSILAAAQNMYYKTDKKDDKIIIRIYFNEEDIRRHSLYDINGYYQGRYDGYTGSGIDNIVALFNNGSDPFFVIGSFEPPGSKDAKSVRLAGARERLLFMQYALQMFLESPLAQQFSFRKDECHLGSAY